MPTAGIGFPSGALSSSSRGNLSEILSNYVFASGIHKPEHSNLLSYRYPQYYLTALLDRIGSEEPVSQRVFSWNEQDRTRIKATCESTASAASGTSIAIEISNSTAATAYFMVGDLLMNKLREVFIITGLNAATNSNQNVDVSLVGGATITTATSLVDGETLGHIGNSFEEGSSAPGARLYLPAEEYNYTHISRRSGSISGDEFTNTTWLGDGESWYFNQQEMDLKELARDKELVTMFGIRSTDGATPGRVTTRGVFDYVDTNGVEETLASTATASDVEDSLQDLIKALVVRGASKELTMLCGASMFKRIQNALRDYAMSGALSYGGFGSNLAGLDFQAYKFMGVRLNVVFYHVFNDEAVNDATWAESATAYNFDETAIVLDSGNGGPAESLLKMRYKELDGQSRKMIMKYELGMMGPIDSPVVSSGDDSFQYHMLCEFGLEFRNSQRCGIMRVNT